MRVTLPILAGLLLLTAVSAFAVSTEGTLPASRWLTPADQGSDIPVRVTDVLRADTTWYGDFQIIGGQYYARSSLSKESVMWTFDRGNGPFGDPNVIENGEGWAVRDETANIATYFKAIDASLNLGLGVPAPIIAGTRSLWVGADKPQADALCWPCGAGYGNTWCQRVESAPLAYNGSGTVTLSFKYFNNTEPCYDGTQVYMRRQNNEELLLNPYPAGECAANPDWELDHGFTDSLGSYSAPLTFTRNITQAEIGAAQNIKIVFEFISDGGWSDEDCSYPTVWGPFGADDVTINGGGINQTYNFESGLGTWTPTLCSPVGDYVNIVDVSAYTILDPCACKLEGNVLEMHSGQGDAGEHPVGQLIMLESPIIDTGNENLKTIFMEFDQYSELPVENGVLYRPGWRYYPSVCEVTGAVRWSDRIGIDTWYYVGADPVCATSRYGGTTLETAGEPVPANARYVKMLYELQSDCAAFAITNCTGITNYTPLLDNLAVGVTEAAVNAPIISFNNGTRFQDVGSYPSNLFNVRAPGPANIATDKNMQNMEETDKAGDSLVVAGPNPGNDPNKRWEARMWWRVARRGAFQADKENGVTSRYKTWKDRVADGKLIDRPYKPQFTFGWMDSMQVGSVPTRNTFLSNFRENDDDFVGEGNAETEMIWDDILYPGTQIEYFITSNYTNTPNVLYYYPDTTGSFFLEFEVLPGVRDAYVPNCGGAGFNYCAYQPATLYIDVINSGAQFYIENALRTVLNGYDPCFEEDGCVIPRDRNWDRYDYLDGSSNWKVPFARGPIPGSNAGMTVNQLLGYQAILVNTGAYSSGAMDEVDFQLFDQWLVTPDCNANTNRQVMVMNGDKIGEMLENWPLYGQPFMTNTLGAILFCDAFNGVSSDPDCSPENTSYCVRLMPVQGGAFGTDLDIDAWGNYCPALLGFNVYSPTNGAIGNRSYHAEDGQKDAFYEQVVRSNASGNYRTVVDGVSWHHMAKRNPSGQGNDVCPTDAPSIVEASLSEIGAALKWGFGVASYGAIPKLTSAEALATCQGTYNIPTGVDENGGNVLVNRLFQNEPNPFNPRTTIKFALASSGPVELLIYDVNGRLVKTLVDGKMDAGNHAITWDGTNDSGQKVGSGVYWSQMKAGSYVSNKKMVILK
ncbi:MAG: FlgD immunoglobulin-like domain containing protein [Candidatus Eisenbacteria bacterium]